MSYKKLSIFLIIGVLIFSLSACTDNKNGEEKPQTENQQEEPREIVYKEYVNDRFNFSIAIPENWPVGNQSQNMDGIVLFEDDEAIDIRIYGANYMEDISEPYKNGEKEGFTKEEMVLDDGEKAIIIKGQENDMIHYEMVRVYNDIEYHFVAKVPEEFFNENRDVLRKLAKSFKVVNKTTELKKEEIIELEEEFINRIFQDTEENHRVKNFDTKMILVDYVAEVADENFVRSIVNNYYQEDKAGLYLIPKDGLTRLNLDESFKIMEIDEDTYEVLQTSENEQIGEYELTITYKLRNGKWIIQDRVVKLLDE